MPSLPNFNVLPRCSRLLVLAFIAVLLASDVDAQRRARNRGRGGGARAGLGLTVRRKKFTVVGPSKVGIPREPKVARPLPLPLARIDIAAPVTIPFDVASDAGLVPEELTPTGREREVELEASDYFEVSDYNSNGWISYREALRSLGLDRNEYALYDIDRDGRVDTEEFLDRYRTVLERAGAFRPPTPEPDRESDPDDATSNLLANFDGNRSGALDSFELEQLLFEFGFNEIASGPLMDQLDLDSSGSLQRDELGRITTLLGDRESGIASSTPLLLGPATSLDHLFGQPIVRPIVFGSTPLPPQIAGPVSFFHRLDYNGDGQVTGDDLARLQSPLQLGVSPFTVIATLDLDGDGGFDAEEFRRSME